MTNRTTRHGHHQLHLKELDFVILGNVEFKFHRAGQQAGDPGKDRCCILTPKAICWQNSRPLGGPHSVLRPSTNCKKPTTLWGRGKLLYSKSTDSNVNVLKTPSQQTLDRCWSKQLGRTGWLVRQTYGTNHAPQCNSSKGTGI